MNDDLVALVADITSSLSDDQKGMRPTPLWDTLAELGLTTITVPEQRGGAGGDLDDLLTVVRALASHGIDTPLAEVAAACWAHPADTTTHNMPILVTADISEDQAAQGFTIPSVPWGRAASTILVLGHSRAWEVCDFDPVFADTPLGVLCNLTVAGGVAKPFEPTVTRRAAEARGALLIAGRLTGALEGSYRLTKGYVAQREQFGKPLLALPAVAAHLARIKISLVESDVALAKAADDVRSDPESWTAAAAARVVTAHAASEVTRIAHQLHGAIGTTEEYSLGRFSRILWAWPQAPISAATWADRLGVLAGTAGEAELWGGVTSPRIIL
jgi:acyl-CoA dehydrogenase